MLIGGGLAREQLPRQGDSADRIARFEATLKNFLVRAESNRIVEIYTPEQDATFSAILRAAPSALSGEAQEVSDSFAALKCAANKTYAENLTRNRVAHYFHPEFFVSKNPDPILPSWSIGNIAFESTGSWKIQSDAALYARIIAVALLCGGLGFFCRLDRGDDFRFYVVLCDGSSPRSLFRFTRLFLKKMFQVTSIP